MGHYTRRDALATVGALAATAALPLTSRAQAPIIIKFSHVVAVDTPKGKGAWRSSRNSPKSGCPAR